MLTKQAAQEIFEVYYEEGVKLAMAEAGLIKVADPKNSKPKAVFGRMHDITAPAEQTMRIKKPMKIQPSKMFKGIASSMRKDPTNPEHKELMGAYLENEEVGLFEQAIGELAKSTAKTTSDLAKTTPSYGVTKKDLSRKPRRKFKKVKTEEDKVLDRADKKLKSLGGAHRTADSVLRDSQRAIDKYLPKTK